MMDSNSPAKKPKDKKIVLVTTATRGCRREHKFKDGDPRQGCPFGLTELDLVKCQNCVWAFDLPGGGQRTVEDPKDMMILVETLHKMRVMKYDAKSEVENSNRRGG